MKRLLKRYEHILKHASTALFLFGFLTDTFLLPDVDNPVTKYLGLGYIVSIGLLIAFREWIVSRNKANERERRFFSLSSFGIAYFSGAALSFVFVYALRSAALSVSWPLFLILLLCMIANEFFASHTYRFALDIMVLLVALVFYILFNVPFIINTQTETVFYITIVTSVVVGALYVALISRISETTENESPKMYALSVGIPMFIAMLYFLNMLPAVPLSLTEGEVFHEVIREENGEYNTLREKDSRAFAQYRTKVHMLTDENRVVFFLSAVRAPEHMTAPLTHEWEYFDNQKKAWVLSTKISFTLEGGRKGGFRAYSKKDNAFPGRWRVTVKVDDKRVVGRYTFVIKEGGPLGELIWETK